MVRRLKKIQIVKNPKNVEIETRHHQKPRHPVTLGEFLPSWFRTRISDDDDKALCCNADKEEEEKNEVKSTLSPSLSNSLVESSFQEADVCNTKITFTEDDFLLGETPHNRPLFMVVIPWIHENKVVPSTYYQCLKYNKDGVENKIVADDKPFSKAEAYFADAKFYLKNHIMKRVKVDDITKAKGKKIAHLFRYVPKVKKDEGESSSLQKGALRELTLPIKQIDTIKLSSKLLENFVAPNMPQNKALPTKRTNEGFDLNAYRLFAKAGYDPNKPSKLGKLLPEATRKANTMKDNEHVVKQSREGLGYKQPPPVRISIRRASINYITTEDEPADPNKRPSVFDRLGEPTTRTSVFERLGPLKRKKNKSQRNYEKIRRPFPSRVQSISKECQSLVPSRMRRQSELLISCGEVLKVKTRIVVHTRECDEDEESVGSSYHITANEEQYTSSLRKFDEYLGDASWCGHIYFNDGDPQKDEDVEDAPAEIEEGIKMTVDALKEVNLGTAEDSRPTYVSALLTTDEENTYVELLKEYRYVFAWSYKEMPGLDPKVAVHHLAVKKGARPVKQAQRSFRPELIPSIEAEVNKLIEAGFIREVKYPSWISSIVPVKKKNGQIRVCVDFKDLNNACPKDEFPLPIPELMIDSTTGYEAMSFMDGSSGYNQIRMAPKDEELTAFRTPKGIYCYKVMPFGLKNVGATYQRAMQNIFDDILHKNVECYEDDLVVKSRKRGDHLQDLRMVFERLRRYQLRMNPLKCAFGVTSGKFLGFIVRHRGIEIDQAKVDAILKMPEPKNIHELKSLQGKLAYLRRFISNLAGKCQPFSRLMKKGIPFEWDQACSNAFQSIKSYLTKPPVLAAPIPGKPLILYIAAQERANPIKFVMSKPVLNDRLARWYLQFQQFEIVHIPQKAVKGQALADFLADHPIPDDWKVTDELPDEDVMVIEVQPPWKMYFNGAAHREGAGAGVVFVTSQGEVLSYSFTLTQHCTNNVAEYQALTLRLEMAIEMIQLQLHIFRDSELVINPMLGSYEVKKIVPPDENEDKESKLERLVDVAEAVKVDWRQTMIEYLCYGIFPEDPRRKTEIRRRAPRFLYYKDTLYRRSFEGVLLRCLGKDEATQAMQEAHSRFVDHINPGQSSTSTLRGWVTTGRQW
ncbi:uncharacterized protein LOC142180854 [Nicotiana tabacum]|uniref:Uncharacterized protein LOC142180854 n=1 Tax=Nicotiana tabacum TaxID=4097 RepID=A0AC58UHT6_TOBAC